MHKTLTFVLATLSFCSGPALTAHAQTKAPQAAAPKIKAPQDLPVLAPFAPAQNAPAQPAPKVRSIKIHNVPSSYIAWMLDPAHNPRPAFVPLPEAALEPVVPALPVATEGDLPQLWRAENVNNPLAAGANLSIPIEIQSVQLDEERARQWLTGLGVGTAAAPASEAISPRVLSIAQRDTLRALIADGRATARSFQTSDSNIGDKTVALFVTPLPIPGAVIASRPGDQIPPISVQSDAVVSAAPAVVLSAVGFAFGLESAATQNGDIVFLLKPRNGAPDERWTLLQLPVRDTIALYLPGVVVEIAGKKQASFVLLTPGAPAKP